MPITQIVGRPGIGAARTSAYRNVFREQDSTRHMTGGDLIDGASRDPFNAEDPFLLQPGLLMGRVTASKEWRPTILGVSANAYTAGGTTITVTAAAAAAIVARVGATGNLSYYGPPAASGTGALLGPIAFSAVNTTTGAVTTATLGANLVAGGLVVAGDGSEVPRSVIGDGWGVQTDGTDMDWPHVPVAGVIDSAKILGWPSDTSIQAYIVASMDANGVGKFIFSHLLMPG